MTNSTSKPLTREIDLEKAIREAFLSGWNAAKFAANSDPLLTNKQKRTRLAVQYTAKKIEEL